MSQTNHLTLARHNPTLGEAYTWLRNTRRRLKIHRARMDAQEHDALTRKLDQLERELKTDYR
jgi:hypothetical protein